MIATEIRDLMPAVPLDIWGVDISRTVKERISSWPPEDAESQFLFGYFQLTGE